MSWASLKNEDKAEIEKKFFLVVKILLPGGEFWGPRRDGSFNREKKADDRTLY